MAFKENSDPIKDMNIGYLIIKSPLNKCTLSFLEFVFAHIEKRGSTDLILYLGKHANLYFYEGLKGEISYLKYLKRLHSLNVVMSEKERLNYQYRALN